MDPDALIKALEGAASNPPKDAQTRQRLYHAAHNLMLKTENQHDLTHRIVFSQTVLTVARIAADLNLFKILSEQGEKGCTIEVLAQKTQADVELLRRIFRGLAGVGLVDQQDGSTFRANSATRSFVAENMIDAIVHGHINIGPILQILPEFLQKTKYQNPVDDKNTPYNVAFNTDLPIFAWMAEHPENMKALVGVMSGARTGQKVWMADPGLFPAEDFTLSAEDLDAGRALMVDMAGGAGQQCIALRTAQPALRGRVVLQDLQVTFDGLDQARRQKLEELNIEVQTHDFLTPQREVGAKVYYIRNVIHDWLDKKNVEILKNLRAAMRPDSVLIIDEIVVREDVSSWKQFNYDIIMMSTLATQERTRRQFEEMLAQAGLRSREVREYDEGTGDSILICVPL